jgi:hypothetical protein
MHTPTLCLSERLSRELLEAPVNEVADRSLVIVELGWKRHVRLIV